MLDRVCTKRMLVPVVLCAVGASLLFSGCRREEDRNVDPAAPEAYMNDPVFRQGLEDRRASQRKIASERARLVARMEELIKLHGEDESKLKQIAEWNELHVKVTALNGEYEKIRRDMLKHVRERIAPKPVSK